MVNLTEVPVGRHDIAGLRTHLAPYRWDQLVAACRERSARGSTIWYVNSTAVGGGVAEMLRPMVGYGRALGLDVNWLVIEADAEFFTVTKRVDNGLSGVAGDGGPLGAAEHEIYRRASAAAAAVLGRFVRPGDLVFLHDPQTAGLVGAVAGLGAVPIWRAHNGADAPNRHTARSWNFLRPYLAEAAAFVTTMPHFAPDWMRRRATATIPPFIDPLSEKNRDMSLPEARAVLGRLDLIDTPAAGPVPSGRPLIVRDGGPPPEDRPLVVQVSRWDPVKDMVGVLTAFAEGVAPATDADLMLVGPEVDGVADDPEAGDYFAECVRVWEALPRNVRRRVHLVCLPMSDPDANAEAVNAVQRHAAVITQKSRSEGFGLTVAEAMWKGKAVVCTRVGGLHLQIPDRAVGVPVPDVDDLRAFAGAVVDLLSDDDRCRSIGGHARERVRDEFLLDKHLLAELALVSELQAEQSAQPLAHLKGRAA